jgi:ribosome assembly protein 1
VDFSGEVSSAVRLSDGAIVVVDAVEGVCNQTHTVLRQAWEDKVKPVLVINKLDRLITELQLSPEEAYQQLRHTLESVNVIMATLFAEEFLRNEREADPKEAVHSQQLLVDEGILTEAEVDDSEVYFSPERGNVLFACAKYGWGFRIQHFAEIYAKRLQMKRDVLVKCLWGEYFFCAKEKTIKRTSNGGKYPRMFVQFILQNLWHVFKVVREERSREQTEKVLKVLGIKIADREMRFFDSPATTYTGNLEMKLVTAICKQWLPLSSALIR